MLDIIKDEAQELKKKFGDERRTELVGEREDRRALSYGKSQALAEGEEEWKRFWSA